MIRKHSHFTLFINVHSMQRRRYHSCFAQWKQNDSPKVIQTEEQMLEMKSPTWQPRPPPFPGDPPTAADGAHVGASPPLSPQCRSHVASRTPGAWVAATRPGGGPQPPVKRCRVKGPFCQLSPKWRRDKEPGRATSSGSPAERPQGANRVRETQ